MTTIVQKLLVALTSTLIVAFLVAWDSRSIPQIQMAPAHAMPQQCNQSSHPDKTCCSDLELLPRLPRCVHSARTS